MFNLTKSNSSGFTLIELLLVTSLIMILVAGAAPLLSTYFTSTQLEETTSQTKQIIQTAHQRALAGVNDSDHGVYFEHNASSNDRIILFQGSSYAARNPDYDYAVTLDTALSYSSTLTNDAIVYSNRTGIPTTTGTLTISHANNTFNILELNELGVVIEN